MTGSDNNPRIGASATGSVGMRTTIVGLVGFVSGSLQP